MFSVAYTYLELRVRATLLYNALLNGPFYFGYLGLPKSNVYRNLPESNINYRNPTIL